MVKKVIAAQSLGYWSFVQNKQKHWTTGLTHLHLYDRTYTYNRKKERGNNTCEHKHVVCVRSAVKFFTFPFFRKKIVYRSAFSAPPIILKQRIFSSFYWKKRKLGLRSATTFHTHSWSLFSDYIQNVELLIFLLHY